MKRIQVKAEVWFELSFDEDLSKKEILNSVYNSENLGDLLDNEIDDYNEILEDIYAANICDKKSIWILNDNDKAELLDH